ncbi:MAG TPA: tRNA uridine-5-carboxymethylaminomethyl(34) synthesis enzyme MnmG [Candidatus Xenobia bacterium]|jgi:tRNA uridine 5-carboxymethylaminomethyl modification enzyme
MIFPKRYDVIVIGAGHAGIEAGLAAARMGCETLMLTINLDTIGRMPCNPSIGGPAKGHLVREVDALGGQMGRAIDQAHLHIRMLNTGKGCAVQALRAQADRDKYMQVMKQALGEQPHLDVKQDTVEDILVEGDAIVGVKTQLGFTIHASCVVVTTGTFLNGLIHMGELNYAAGRSGEPPSVALSASLKSLGLTMGRLKTGTPPRVNKRSIDFAKTTPQEPSDVPLTFSYESPQELPEQLLCYLTTTTLETKRLILENIHRSPMYSGLIEGTGPRYCPSIEDKIMRFQDKDTHQVFLEPEGHHTLEVYVQGMSTSLPMDVQIPLIRSVVGLENADIMRYGYAVEYDFVFPEQLHATLETKPVQGLFLAGQINGTSGYEEAAAQGIIAGINAARRAAGQSLVTLGRDEAYIGVLIDDLVTKGTIEPYRMMTSRAEYRLLLRQDNADQRLTGLGHEVGLIPRERYDRFCHKWAQVDAEVARLSTRRVRGQEAEALTARFDSNVSAGTTFFDLLKRPQITWGALQELDPEAPGLAVNVVQQVEIRAKYEGYIKRQEEQVKNFQRYESMELPHTIDYGALTHLSKESREKFTRQRPATIGQASRISGVKPEDVQMLILHLETGRRRAAR